MSLKTVSSPQRATGSAVLVCVLMVLCATLLLAPREVGPARSAQDETTRQVLAEARDALLGYTVAYPDRINPRFGPGYLPCPARDQRGIASSACASASGTTFGRFPWHTLRANDLRDGAGEGLWYAISPSHRYNPKTVPLNGMTPAGLLADGKAVVAVLIAPGAAIGHQHRRPQAPGDPGQFLEGTNADGDHGRFGAAAAGNDQMLTLDAAAFEAMLTTRVIGEFARRLRDYAVRHAGRYPWLLPPGAGEERALAPGVLGVRAGWLPVHAAEVAGGTPYTAEFAPQWALTHTRITADLDDGLLPVECLTRMPCMTATGEVIVLRGVADCGWWAAPDSGRPPRDHARCELTTRIETGDRTFHYRLSFAVVDDDGNLDISGPDLRGPRRRQVRVTELGRHAMDPAFGLVIALAVTTTDGREDIALVELTTATTGHFNLPDLPYGLDVDAGELPLWVVTNGWHRHIALAHADCLPSTACLAVHLDLARDTAAPHAARALLLAPGFAPVPEPGPLARFTASNRAALLDPTRAFTGTANKAVAGDRVLIVEPVP
jgi:hypothetical protein